MKHQNLVMLDGVLRDPKPIPARPGDGRTSALLVTVVTDNRAHGGHHAVLLPGGLAIEAWAFLEAAGSECVDATVLGWLRSRPGDCLVVADSVRFHVGEAVRRAAGKKVAALLEGK